ncbi:MAG: phosphotriesterase-related protein [Roseiflexaceae bacterium]
MKIIRTVCGDIPIERLGLCLPHEHLLGHPPDPREDRDFWLDSEAAASRELSLFAQAGGSWLVEMSPREYGRNPLGLERLARATGVAIVCVTGNHKQKFAASVVADQSVEQLAELYIQEVNHGIDASAVRAGVIKAGSSLNMITPLEERIFRAAALAQQATGAAISTHTEAGTMALEQIALLRTAGVPAERIVIGHLDRCLDWGYLAEVASTGVFMGFDQIAKEKYAPDHARIAMIERLIVAGHTAQILLAGDQARRSAWPSYGGGPGLSYIPWRFVPWLREAGIDQQTITQLTVHNPAQAFGMLG